MANSKADYIIVGGGLTGCAIASRLHQSDPSLGILILEAGIDATDNPLTRDLGGAFALAGSEHDYDYKTTPQSNTDNRIHSITAGKVLGGGSILNYGAWARGDAMDYDHWGKTVKDHRWSYKGLLPYLKKSESHFEATKNPQQRGADGPIRVTSVYESDPKRRYGLRKPIRAAWEELGLKENPNADSGSLHGIADLLENWHDGERQPSNLAYNLEGVRVITGATVHKITFTNGSQGVPTATGILLTDKRHFIVRKEIILSAGTIKTPQILMLSGIGPADLLSSHSIPVAHDNLEVGRNYFDHFALFQLWKLRYPEAGLAMGSPHWKDTPSFSKGLPCDWAVNEGTPSQLLEPALDADAAEGKVSDLSLLQPQRCTIETMVMYSPVGAPVPVDGTHIATSVMLLLPTSRGSITITSSSPTDHPRTDPNYYSTATDRAALIHGVRCALTALLTTTACKSHIEYEAPPPNLLPLTPTSSDVEIDSRIRAGGVSHAHGAGTCAMGKVVDSRLRVMGVKGLRVADASVFPVAVGGHPQATLYGIAEQAAEMIIQDRHLK